MTGFGTSSCDFPDKKVTIEIKSLNGKLLDLYLKLPPEYSSKEAELRNTINQHIIRAKVYVNVTIENIGAVIRERINHQLVESYYREIKALSESIGLTKEPDYFTLIFRMPDIMNTGDVNIDTKEWNKVEDAVQNALNKLDEFRIHEGMEIMNELYYRISLILQYLEQLIPYENERINAVRERIMHDLRLTIEENRIDQNRFEQEMIYYLEKLDITEEKQRLKKHCDYFLETLESSESNGKKLGFVCQEIGREINTLGSKANHTEILKLVINMKDELEKIKEQLMNVL